MARLLLSMQRTPFLFPLPGIAVFMVVMGVLSVFLVVNFLCGSHGGIKRSDTFKRKRNVVCLGDRKPGLSKLGSSLSSKALLMTKMISWRKVQDDGLAVNDDNGDDEAALWKRTIIMGERCRPLEFSGKISHNENHKLTPPHTYVDPAAVSPESSIFSP